jgi:hypothetical protein
VWLIHRGIKKTQVIAVTCYSQMQQQQHHIDWHSSLMRVMLQRRTL